MVTNTARIITILTMTALIAAACGGSTSVAETTADAPADSAVEAPSLTDQLGFRDVSDVDGGILSWEMAELPTVTE